MHRDGDVKFPSIHANFFSTVHLDEHPSPSSLLPSSHYTLESFPSPHIYTQDNEIGSRENPSRHRQELFDGTDLNFKAELQLRHVIILPVK